MVEFQYPYLFVLLIIFIICAFTCKYKNATIYMSLLTQKSPAIKTNYMVRVIKWLGIIALIVSLASPIIKKTQPATKPAHAVVLLMDTSESMVKSGNGFFSAQTRSDKFDKAKEIASSYIEQRGGDHIGIIVFGDFAYVASPLSFDHKSSAEILRNIEQGVAGNKTAMIDALFLSTRLLKDTKAKEKVVILLTDGFNTSGTVPYEATMRAVQSENIKVFTIGIGRNGEFDARILQDIAQQSGGVFFHSLSADGLKNIYEKIDQIQKSELRDKESFEIQYLYIYPLLVSIISFFIYILLIKGRRI